MPAPKQAADHGMSGVGSSDRKAAGLLGLGLLAVIASVLLLSVFPASRTQPLAGGKSTPTVKTVHSQDGSALDLLSSNGGELYISSLSEGPLQPSSETALELPLQTDDRRTERLVSTPSAMQWYHPFSPQPSAMVLRVAELDANGKLGPERIATLPTVDHGRLPVLSLVIPEGSLFDADSGLYIVGNAMLNGISAEGIDYASDPKWWKYPGNFHGRGKQWERSGQLQLLDADGTERFQGAVRVRINGQMTRSFPQHSLRIKFEKPLATALYVNGEGKGMKAAVVRAAGNDQIKAFMRDALLQELCAGSRSEMSHSLTCVLYINGAYWGVHHIRNRMDEKEVARRHDLKSKKVFISEVAKGSFTERTEENSGLRKLVYMDMDGGSPAEPFMQLLEEQLDVDAFLEYMAIMFYMDNRDWPGDNVRLWRSTDDSADGRWRPIIQDLDLAFGAHMPATADPFPHFRSTNSPIGTLFLRMMQDEGLRQRFHAVAEELLSTRFAPKHVISRVDSMEALLAPEMDRHTARWRKPSSAEQWRSEVQKLRDFAAVRPDALRAILKATPIP